MVRIEFPNPVSLLMFQLVDNDGKDGKVSPRNESQHILIERGSRRRFSQRVKWGFLIH